MSAQARRRLTAIRNARFAPAPKRNMARRIILLAIMAVLVLTGGTAIAAFAYVNSVSLPKHLGKLIRNEVLGSQNSLILASNHQLLFQSVDRNTGSKTLKPLELNWHNPKLCPQGRHTKSAKFFYSVDHLRVQYLTCNGWGIPAELSNATIATEDPTFYSNPGFDPLSILRAAVQDLTSGQIQSGASTIAQQIAKQFILQDTSPTLTRKAKEIVLAYLLTQKFPKRFILYLYLNGVYYGARAYGVQAAAQTYFQRDVSKLSLWQAAMIAGMPQSPSYYDPYNDNDAATTGPWYSRMLEVLNFLQERGYISRHAETVAEERAAQYHFKAAAGVRIKWADFVTFMEDQLQAMTDPESPKGVFDPYLTRRLH